MKFIIDNIIDYLYNLFVKLADFSSVYMCWGALGEEELPQELNFNKFEKIHKYSKIDIDYMLFWKDHVIRMWSISYLTLIIYQF